ncbi:metallophosphoesterase family protein [Planctomycetes bacterium K23_9]|uniref:Putative metallophosphoesterase YhaO n=1 Tax=Stieleria marina TaxID=1930275 RepID=A0A517P1S0_9BACT|nr:putative metallophosphoesterase YhaO [Planctomycetes bacterium K23_9]
MPGESFRFIHASDFHLEKPLSDLDSLPPHLHEAMAGAPRAAAKAVLDAALVENIDFVVLCGDLISPLAAGPYGMSLLLDYFDQLNENNTPVFWAAGVVDDPANWPDSVPLPPNVTLFPKDRAVSVPVERAGRTICHVIGRSCDGRPTIHVPSYNMDLTDGYTVAVGHGSADAGALAEGRFDYWALGGKHNPETITGAAEQGADYCGSPQGRDLTESGAHGYTIVDVDAEGQTRTHQMQCDTFRYCHVEIDAADIAMTGNLRNLMGERVVRLQHENGGRHLILGWDISITDGEMLHSIGDTQELLQWVRSEYGHGSPSAWTAQLTVRPPQDYPKSWHEEETILGDFLRIAAEHRKSDGREISLLPFTEEHKSLVTTSANLLAEVSAASRKDTLDQATLLGVELLRGGKPNLVQKS